MDASFFKWFLPAALFSMQTGFGSFGSGSAARPDPDAVKPDTKGVRSEERHPFYVSVTEINHNAAGKILEISCKLFTNDFEAVLEKDMHAKADLSVLSGKADNPAKKALEAAITFYITRNLRLKVDGRPVSLQYIGSEIEQEATWNYFQVGGIAAVKRLDIDNCLLYDGFDKEINIMHAAVGGERKSGKLDYPEHEIVLTWP